MRYFLDTEFFEDGRTIDLISIGVVAEDGREFYAVSQDAQLHRVSPWVRENVLPQLPRYGDPAWMTRNQIAERLIQFVHGDIVGKGVESKVRVPEIWAYFADYDWVAVCQLFGTMMYLPNGWPKFCMDLKQMSVELGNPEHPKQEAGIHNALDDARWNRDVYAFLKGLEG